MCYWGYIGSPKSWKLYYHVTVIELEWWIWEMTYQLGVILFGLLLSPNEDMAIGNLHCLSLLFVVRLCATCKFKDFNMSKRKERLFVWWKHGFICITKRDQERNKHGRKIEGMRYQLCAMKKRRNEKQNLNISYSIVGNNSSKMPNNKSFNLYVPSIVWRKPKNLN